MDMKNSRLSPSTASRDQHNQLWMVPYTRNPLFTGREAELQEMSEKYEQLLTKTSVTRAKREEKLKQGESEKQVEKRSIKGIVRRLKGSAQAK